MNYQLALSTVKKPDYKITLINAEGLTSDIMQSILKTFDTYKQDTIDFAKYFAGGSVRHQAERVWRFLRENIIYREDSANSQYIKRPSVTIWEKQADCKGLTILANSILHNLGIVCFFEFARYKDSQPKPTHVYSSILDEKGNTFYLDACLSEFGIRKRPKYFITMSTQISQISGFFDSIGDAFSNAFAQLDPTTAGTPVSNIVAQLDPTSAGTAGNILFNSTVKPVIMAGASSLGLPPEITGGLLNTFIPGGGGIKPIKPQPQPQPQPSGMTAEEYQAYIQMYAQLQQQEGQTNNLTIDQFKELNKDNPPKKDDKKSNNTPLFLAGALGFYFMTKGKKGKKK